MTTTKTPVVSTSSTQRVEPVQIAASSVIVNGYFYIVDLGDPVRPRHHHVGINGECICALGRSCPSVSAVRAYLADGGKRAERPPFGFYPVHPAKCPIKGCGARVYHDASLSSRNRGAGWTCSVGGATHYWQHRGWISSMRHRLKS
jgi:hypothetical protein